MSPVQACCRRQGDYTSPSAGEISFNNQLAEPMLGSLAVAWDALFGTQLAQHLR